MRQTCRDGERGSQCQGGREAYMCVFVCISFILESMLLLTLKSFGRSFLRIERRAKATLDPMAILSREQKRTEEANHDLDRGGRRERS